jgi:hypothetical protein
MKLPDKWVPAEPVSARKLNAFNESLSGLAWGGEGDGPRGGSRGVIAVIGGVVRKGVYSAAIIDRSPLNTAEDDLSFAINVPSEDMEPTPGTSGEACQVINPTEIGMDVYGATGTEAELEIGSAVAGFVYGVTTDDPPIKTVIANGGRGDGGWENANADPELNGDYSGITIGDGTEGSEAADSNEWSRGDGPLRIYIGSREFYDHAGSKILYGYSRQWTIDASGCVRHIGAEQRYEVDQPGPCTSGE